MNYEKEIAKIQSWFDEEVYAVLQDCEAFLAGGALTSLFTNKDVNDLDVYFPNEKAFTLFIRHLYGKYTENNFFRHYRQDGILSASNCRVNFYTKKAIMCWQGGGVEHLQLICARWYTSATDIFNTFDFTINMAAFNFKDETLEMHEDFLKHNSQRYLYVNTETSYPIVSALRVKKYENRGYKIPKAQFLKLMFAVNQKDYQSWEDAKEEVGGLYGVPVEHIFDTTQEFSLPEMFIQLDKAENVLEINSNHVQSYGLNYIQSVIGDKIDMRMFEMELEEAENYAKQ
jgi:hypothetical protein